MISLTSIKAAIRRSMTLEAQARSERDKWLAAKRARQREREAAWLEEQARREAALRDEDGSRARAKAELAEQRMQDQLDSLTAAILRRQQNRS